MTGPPTTVVLEIDAVLDRFPAFRVAVLCARDLAISPGSEAIEAFVSSAERTAAAYDGGSGALPEIRDWREAYHAFGIRKTSYRSSVERLLRNLERGRGLPRINALVDLYNALSALYRMPVGADDLDCVRPPLAFRPSRPGDSFIALGDPAASPDPPKPGEIVYADAEKVLCRRWNWYQDARSAVTPATRRAVLTLQALASAGARLEEAAGRLAGLLEAHLGARTAWAVADGRAPRVAIEVG